jgi:hypothetical protein
VEKLRVLAIQAEPPEIAPHPDPSAVHTAALHTFVVRADFAGDPARPTTVVHVACVPTPGDPAPSPCTTFESLREPAAAVAAAAPGACAPAGGEVAFAGVESCAAGVCGPATAAGAPLPRAEVVLDPEYGFSTATPAERILGVQAVVLAFAIDASPDELVAAGAGATPCATGDLAAGLARLWGERERVLSTKRVVIRGPEAPDAPNENPAIAGIEARGILLDPDAPTTVGAGAVTLAPRLPPDANHQPYTKLDAAGAPIESTQEEWVYSWFSTAGELDELHTREADPDVWTVTGSASGAPALVAAVVRDLRGGTGWVLREVRVGP